MSFKGRVHYFAVGESAAMHAAVWRMWNPDGKSDVYLGSRLHARALKLSIHESGVRHMRLRDPADTESPRDWTSWRVSRNGHPGTEFAWSIVTPFGGLRAAQLHPRFTDRVMWTPQWPQPYTATQFHVALVHGITLREGDWPGSGSGQTDCLLRWPLPNGETLFLLRSVVMLTNEQISSWGRALITTRLPADWEPQKKRMDHRLMLVLDASTGYHGCVDLAFDV